MNGLEVIMIQQDSLDCKTVQDVQKNIEATLEWMDRAMAAYPETDQIIFPECGIQGGHPSPDADVPFAVPGQQTLVLQEKCRQKKVWAEFNFLEKSDGKVYNTSIIVDDKGDVALKYRKVNTFVPVEGNYPGNEFAVCKGPKGAVFGLMICYDGDFPEVGRELAYMGANVLIRPTSYMTPYDLPWEFTNRARAYENTAYVLACNRCGTGSLFTCFGASTAVDYDGRILAQAPSSGEWMLKTTIYPELADQMRKERKRVNHLYNLKHRGYAGAPPEGMTDNPYKVAYGNWK